MGERQQIGGCAFLFNGERQNAGQQRGHQLIRPQRHASQIEGLGIADPAFELPGHPVRFGHAPLVGGFADQQLAVFTGQHHRRHHRRPVPQGDDAGLAPGSDRGRRVRGAQVNAQSKAHTALVLLLSCGGD